MADHAIKEISKDISQFYKQFELKYWGNLPDQAIKEKIAVRDFFKTLSGLSEQAVKQHSSSSPREKLASECTNLHSLSCSEVVFWKKSIQRRMFFKARHAHPWLIDFTSRLFQQVFNHILEMLTCVSMYGVLVEENAKERVLKITEPRKLKQFFDHVCGSSEGNTGFRKNSGDKGFVDLTISDSKPFTCTFNYKAETIRIMVHYGSWNADGVPQFL